MAKAVKKVKKLTKADKLFCQVYVDTRNGGKASRAAGYKVTDHYVNARYVLSKSQIKEHIATLEAKAVEFEPVSVPSLLNRLSPRVNATMADYLDITPDGVTINLAKCEEAELAGIASYKRITTTRDETVTVTEEIKLCDRDRPSELVAKYLGMFEKDNEQRLPVVLTHEIPGRG